MNGDWHIALCDLLERLTQAHTAWLEACREHAASLRQADSAGAGRAQQAQQDAMQRVAELEHERRTLVEGVAQRMPALRQKAGRTPNIEDLAALLDGPEAAVLRERASRLRSLVEQVQREQASLKLAARTLAAHMEGLLRQVANRLGEQAAYGPRARNAPRAGGPAALDVTL